MPKHLYKLKIDQVVHVTMKVKGDKAKKSAGANMQTPTSKNVTTHTETVTATGNLVNDTLFPFKMTMVKNSSISGASGIPDGTEIFGHASVNGSTVFDSIVADGLDAKMKSKVFGMLSSLTDQIKVPDHTFKPGEKFTQKMPVSLPVSGIQLNMVINTTYKLKSIINGNANFDIEQVYVVTGAAMSADIKMKGTGSGALVYNIKNRYYTSYTLNTNFDMDISLAGDSMHMKMESASSQSVDITEN